MIKNKTRETVLANRFKRAKGLNKFVGLMGKKKPAALVLQTRFGIHTFFLKFPIDIVIVNKNKKVVLTKKCIMPNKILIWNIRFDTVIELPEGTIDRTKTRRGDILEFNL